MIQKTVFIFKLKKSKEDKTMAIAAQGALAQIEEKQYEAELRMRGIKKIIKLAIIFDKKKILVVSK